MLEFTRKQANNRNYTNIHCFRWKKQKNHFLLPFIYMLKWLLHTVLLFVTLLSCRVCYERCPYNPTAATFLLSAMWHGAYPGYYLTFLTGIVITLAARAVSDITLYQTSNTLQIRNIPLTFIRCCYLFGHEEHRDFSQWADWLLGRLMKPNVIKK